MEIDPRLRTGSDKSSVEATEYPEPPHQFSVRHSSSTPVIKSGPNRSFYGTPSPSQAQSDKAFHREEQQRLSSVIRVSPQLDSAADPNDPYSDLKRPRACEACRQLKVRCEPDLVNPDGSCRRCAKAGRSCVVTVPTRKRQKKTDSRVAELERKIDALTASLQASHGPDSLLQSGGAKEHVGRRWLGPGQGNTSNRPLSSSPLSTQMGNKRSHSGEVKDSREPGLLTQIYSGNTSSPSTEQQSIDTPGKQWRGPWSSNTVPSPMVEAGNSTGDIIDRGLVSPAIALEAFTRFVDKMSHHIPMVVISPGTQMSEIRKHKPVLFHAIIAVAVGPFDPDAHIPLLNELYKVIAERVIVKGEKSLDLVQALLMSCTFYTPPENFEAIKFYQLAQLAVSVGMDIGMYRKSSSTKTSKSFNLLREMPKSSTVPDPDSPEMRRTWLGCYFLTIQVSTALRRPILVRWLPYMDECVSILETSPEALPSDKAMIQWAKLVRIVEEISLQFFGDDPGSIPSFSEAKFQYTLKAFEKQIENWRKETLPQDYSPAMKQAEAIVGIYLHENAMNMDNEDNKTPNEDISNPSTAARISALSAALTSIHQVLDTICSIETKDLVNYPTITLARTSFAIVALIKLYSIVAAPESYIGQVIEPSNLRVEYYLDKVIGLYSDAGKLPGALTPAKFSTVLSMLRDWFMKRKDQNAALKEAFHGPRGPGANTCDIAFDRNQSHEPSKIGHTPLQLLSEVAMGEPKNSSIPGHHQQQHQQHSNPHQQQPLYPARPGGDFSSTDPASQSPSDLVSQSLASRTSGAPDSETWAPYPGVPSQRQFYSPFQQGSLSGYPDPSGNGMDMTPSAMASQGIFVPELGIHVGYDPENLFALGTMLGDGVFNLPLPADMGFF